MKKKRKSGRVSEAYGKRERSETTTFEKIHLVHRRERTTEDFMMDKKRRTSCHRPKSTHSIKGNFDKTTMCTSPTWFWHFVHFFSHFLGYHCAGQHCKVWTSFHCNSEKQTSRPPPPKKQKTAKLSTPPLRVRSSPLCEAHPAPGSHLLLIRERVIRESALVSGEWKKL